MERKNKGKMGEEQALALLVAKGWEILELNFRSGRAEIDIIALEQEKILVFVEVKTRKNNRYGEAALAVSEAQQRKIYEAAEDYIYAINWQGDIRFDVIGIDGKTAEITHVMDAFYF